MKKYFNKALMYQWFHSAKGIIAIGIFIWMFVSNRLIKLNINRVRNSIAYDFNNSFSGFGVYEYIILAFIFMAVYYSAMGANKKNTSMFLYSGPNTRKSIKINGLICLFITLLIFVLVYAYVILMAYIQERQLLSIVNGFWIIVIMELSKVLIIGTFGILVLMVLDMLFINSIAAVLSMISIFPLLIFLTIREIGNILCYFPFGSEMSVMTYLMNRSYGIFRHPYFAGYSVLEIRLKYLCADIFTCILAIAVMFIIFIIMQKKNRLENSVHVFSSKKAENFIVIITSGCIGLFIESILALKFIDKKIWSYSDTGILYGAELIMIVGIQIILITLITLAAFFGIKKVLKKIG